MKKILLIFFASFYFSVSYSQVDPVYSQYMFNPVVINPAYSGLHDMASFYGVHRTQWTGVEEYTVETFTASGQTTLPKNNLGVGFSYVYDKVGFTQSHDINAMASYKLNLGNKSVSFGLQGGGVFVDYDYTGINLKDNDQEFEGIGSGTGSAPTLGFGLLYSSRTMFVGASMPRAIDITVDDGTASGTKLYRNYILTGGYVVHLNKKVKLKPSVLFRLNKGSDLVYDFNFSALFMDRFWGGLSLRSLNALALMSQVKLSDFFTAGVAYEFPVDGKSISQLGNVFELMLNCNISIFDVQAVQTVFY